MEEYRKAIFRVLEDRGNYDVVEKSCEMPKKNTCHMLVDFKWKLNAWEKQVTDFTMIAYKNDDGKIQVLY